MTRDQAIDFDIALEDRQADIAELYLAIRDVSVFSHFQPRAARRLIQRSTSLRQVGAGAVLDPIEGVMDLHVVASGVVGLYRKDRRGTCIGKVTVGRSLELRSILTGRPDWEYEWRAEQPAQLLVVARPALDELLDAEPRVRAYLSRIVLNPELRRFRNDLRLLGFSNTEAIAAFECLEEPTLLQTIDAPHAVHVVKTGEIRLRERARNATTHCAVGDYALLDPGNKAVEAASDPDTVTWRLDVERWRSASERSLVDNFIKVHGASTQAPRSQAAPRSTVVIPVIEDDDLQIEQFFVDEAALKRVHARRPKVVRQHDEMDCGAACLSAVARFHGRRIGIAEFRGLVHVTREGSSLFSLKRAAEKVGFKAIGVTAGVYGLLKANVPFIALKQYHFVVVHKLTEAEVVVADPALGLVKMTMEEFEKGFSNSVLLLTPTPELKRYPESSAGFLKYVSLFRGHGLDLATIFLVALMSFALGLATPLGTMILFDQVLVRQDPGPLVAALLIMGSTSLLGLVLGWTRTNLVSHLTTRIDAKFSHLFLRQAYALPLSYFAVRRTGDLTSRLGELGKIQNFMSGRSIAIVLNLLSVVLYSCVVVIFDWRLLATIAVGLPLMVGFVAVTNPKIVMASRQAFKASARNTSVIAEQIRGFDTVSSLAATTAARWRWEASYIDFMRESLRQLHLGAVTGVTSNFLRQSMAMALLIVAASLYMTGDLSMGQVVAVSALSAQVIGPVLALFGEWAQLQQVALSVGRVDDVVTARAEVEPETDAQAGFVARGRIEFRDVTFQYGGELSPVILQDVSLTIEPGETVAFVGSSGSGKTTLAYMVNRLYEATKGEVILDGVPVEQIPKAVLRRQVGMVLQDNSLFSGTVFENIALGDPKPSLMRAVEAARAADAHDFVMALPKGYATVLGDGGAGFSGGQRQRLCIARALYQSPPVLIMDEATSALDAVSEKAVVGNIKSATARKITTIVIAHRLNTVRHADRIVVLERGSIAEVGTHDELIARQGRYFDLFRRQMSD